ncbi:MAG: hypothetical protein AAFN78_02190, partial [Pseudomonadota bacterium]
ADDLLSTGFTTVPGVCNEDAGVPLYANIGTVVGLSPAGVMVDDSDPSHYCNPQAPGIDIEKSTNGVDADDPNAGDAPQIAPGELVSWQYLVTNTGNTTLTGVSVVDDQGVVVSCPMDTLEPGESMVCTASGLAEDLLATASTTVPGLCGTVPNTPLYENMGTASGTSLSGALVQDVDASHYCNPQTPGVDIEKATNGVDADDPNAGDAPQIAPGELVSWTYIVTNTGNTTLTDVVVTDDQGVPVTCPMDTLAPGESMTCTASGLADDLLGTTFTTVPGQCGGFPNTPLYENRGSVSAMSATGEFVEDADLSHYCNPQTPGIDIEKSTNGVDADDPNAGDAPQIAPGDLVSWTYEVTNTGNTTLTGVAVTDDQGVPVVCPMDTLEPGESMTCTASAFADDLLSTGFTTVPGLCGSFPQTPLYQNMGTASGMSVNGDLVEDTDLSHYCNPQTPGIDIEKATNGIDADDPNAGDAPAIAPGELVSWIYVVTNTGNTTLTDVVVTDDQGVPVSCPMDTLEPGESMSCTASGFADDLLSTGFTTVIGLCGEFPNTPLYQNMGMATGQSVDGALVDDTDPSHYCNPQVPGIDIEKTTNGVDADDPNAGDAPQIMPGELVNWSYLVTNTGNTTLTGVTVTDDQGVAVTCPQDTLEPGESIICTASGLADDLLTTGFTTVPGLCGSFPQTPLYQNMGMASANSATGGIVEDVDASHYCNPQEPGIDIEKATNGVDADDPNAGDAPTIAIGNPVNWTYIVTNTGNTTLTGVTVTDDQGVVVTCPMDTLAPGESMTCTASGVADNLDTTGFTTVPGLCAGFPQEPLYQNKGEAMGTTPAGALIRDVDPSHYCNPPMPGIDIEKATNGVDADDPNAGDAPVVAQGNLVSWTYLVTNTGDVTLFNVVVTDDQGVAVSCPMDSLLPGQMMTCTASGLADDLDNTAFTTVPGLCGGFPQEPLYQNMGMASGDTITGLTLTDTDPSHYCNPAAPAITVEKATNGIDADDPNAGDAPLIMPGDTVNWTYLVTNTGDVTLSNVVVTDDQGVIVICPQDTLVPGESMICTASGTAVDTTDTIFTTVPGVCGETPNTPLYRNMGLATGDTVTGVTVQDDDPSHYCNVPMSVCPPTFDFEVDSFGELLAAGQIIDDEFAGYGVQVTTDDPVNNPVMIFNSAFPTGGDPDLGTPNEDFGGPGIGDGGGLGQPGVNFLAERNVLIISEDGDSGDPDDSFDGGTITFTFDEPVVLDSVGILDIDSQESMGTVTAYDENDAVILTVPMQDLGNNSVQRLVFGIDGVRRIDVWFPSSGAVTDITFCPDDEFCVLPAEPDAQFSTSNFTHSFWLPGIDTDLAFVPDAGSFIENEDGTAVLSGSLHSLANPGRGFDVVVNLAGRTNVPPPGSPKLQLDDSAYVDNGGPIDPGTWRYYPTMSGVLTGTGDYEGAVIDFVPTGGAFQAGIGANGKNLNNGASSWFLWTVTQQPNVGHLPETGQGDLNVDFRLVCLPDICVEGDVADNFNHPSFSNNDGSFNWAAPWIEHDPAHGGEGPNAGNVTVSNGALMLNDYPDTGGHPSAARTVDLSGYTSATLKFDFWTTHGVDDHDAVTVEISSDGGQTFTTLEVITGIWGEVQDWRMYDITPYISSQTQVRFRVSDYYGAHDETFKVHFVQIEGFCVDLGPDTIEVLDKFDDHDFDGNNGPDDWSGPWMEDDPESGGAGPSNGAVKVSSGALRLDDQEDTGGQPSAKRSVDLTGMNQATFSFTYDITEDVDESDAVVVEVSSDGVNFTVLETFTGIEDGAWGSRSYDISAFISANTTVRFRISAYYGGSYEYFYADHVGISATR